MKYMYILMPDAHFTQLLPVALIFRWTEYISSKQGLHVNVGSKLTILEIFPLSVSRKYSCKREMVRVTTPA